MTFLNRSLLSVLLFLTLFQPLCLVSSASDSEEEEEDFSWRSSASQEQLEEGISSSQEQRHALFRELSETLPNSALDMDCTRSHPVSTAEQQYQEGLRLHKIANEQLDLEILGKAREFIELAKTNGYSQVQIDEELDEIEKDGNWIELFPKDTDKQEEDDEYEDSSQEIEEGSSQEESGSLSDMLNVPNLEDKAMKLPHFKIHLFREGIKRYQDVLRVKIDDVQIEERGKITLILKRQALGPSSSMRSLLDIFDITYDLDIPEIPKAAVIFANSRNGRLFAFTIGNGRYLLKDENREPNFGLRMVGNQAKTQKCFKRMRIEEPSRNTRQTQTAYVRPTTADAFDPQNFNPRLLKAVDIVQKQKTQDGIKKRRYQIKGTEKTLSLPKKFTLDQIPFLIEAILRTYQRKDFRQNLPLLSQIETLTEPDLIDRCEQEFFKERQKGSFYDVVFPSKYFTDISKYRYRIDNHDEEITNFSDLSQKIRSDIHNTKNPEDFKLLLNSNIQFYTPRKKERPYLNRIYNWLIYSYQNRDVHIVLRNGQWYRYNPDCTKMIYDVTEELFVPMDLPSVDKSEKEYDYSVRIARDYKKDWLVVDRQCSQAGDRKNSKIEVCDLLTPGKELVHVKFGNSFPYLFSQGTASFQNLRKNFSYRQEAVLIFLKRIITQYAEKALEQIIPKIRTDNFKFVRENFKEIFGVNYTITEKNRGYIDFSKSHLDEYKSIPHRDRPNVDLLFFQKDLKKKIQDALNRCSKSFKKKQNLDTNTIISAHLDVSILKSKAFKEILDKEKQSIQSEVEKFLSIIPFEGFKAKDYTVFYLIGSKKGGKSHTELSFTSLISLYDHSQIIRKFGGKVRVGLFDASAKKKTEKKKEGVLVHESEHGTAAKEKEEDGLINMPGIEDLNNKIKELRKKLQINKTGDKIEDEIAKVAEEFDSLIFDEGVFQRYWERYSYGSSSVTFLRKISFDKWSHQTWKEALGGWLFFPQELEDQYDSLISIYGRMYVHYGLAYSGRYKNPVALYYLSELVKNFNTTGEDESMNEIYKSLLSIVSFLSNLREDSSTSSKSSFLFAKEYLNWLLKEQLEQPFLKSYESKDVRGMFYYALYLSDNDKRSKIYQELSMNLHYPKARLNLARMCKDDQEAYEQYLKAGEAGVAEGYYHSGDIILSKSETLKEKGIDQLLKAGKMGCLRSYDRLADYYLAQKDYVEAKKWYEEKGNRGDPKGFYDLALLYKTLKEMDKAKEYFEKSGYLLGHFNWAELVEKEDDREKIYDNIEKFYKYHFENLKKIALGESL